MFANRKSTIACPTALAFTVVLCTPRAWAQSATLVGRFTTLNGTIDFLPGAWVSTWENGRATYYKFQGGRFVRSPQLPEPLHGWESFSWDDGVDFSDQIARSDYDPRISEFLPKERKVKKVIEFNLRSNTHEDLVLICFTLNPADPSAPPGDTDIYTTALAMTPGTSGSTYKKLWTCEMEADVSYGDLSVQKVPGIGRFIVLYWGQAAGSGTNQGLNVYRLRN
jgi:hypothetical protein